MQQFILPQAHAVYVARLSRKRVQAVAASGRRFFRRPSRTSWMEAFFFGSPATWLAKAILQATLVGADRRGDPKRGGAGGH